LAGGAKIFFEGCATEPFLAGGAKILFEGCASPSISCFGKKTATIRANLLVFSRKNSFFPIILKEIRLLK
jgi:hypothetical protein